MPFDAHKNLAISSIATPPNPPGSGTSLVVAAGEGARFPVAPFNVTIWPNGALPTPTNAEIVRVTAKTADTFTILRAQEGTIARAILVGDVLAATITAKSLTDIESLVTGGSAPHHLTHEVGGTDAITGALALTALTASGDITTINGHLVFSPGKLLKMGVISIGDNFFAIGGFPGESNACIKQGVAGTGTIPIQIFYNANGAVGGIDMAATSVTYKTSSDARLKDDRGRLSREHSGDILRRSVIHDFTWKVDGSPGRGVFAQEALAVAPFAVSVGTDDVDAQGRLTTPWGVDYSKYVPDLIVGWQAHDAQIAALTEKVRQLEVRLAALTPSPSDQPGSAV